MNRIYRLIWCRSMGAVVAVSGLASTAHRCGNTPRRSIGKTSLLLSAIAMVFAAMVHSPAAWAQDRKLADLQSVMARYDTSRPLAETVDVELSPASCPVVCRSVTVAQTLRQTHVADMLRSFSSPRHLGKATVGTCVREWDNANGKRFGCQYQTRFDEDRKASAFYWQPSSSKWVLEQAVAPLAATSLRVPAQPIRLAADALSDFNGAELSRPDREQPAGLLHQVRQASQIENLRVVGYADRLGSDTYNQALSQQRAESVRNYLVRGGLAPTAIQVLGGGEQNQSRSVRTSRAAAWLTA